jgi:hypothetical protein
MRKLKNIYRPHTRPYARRMGIRPIPGVPLTLRKFVATALRSRLRLQEKPDLSHWRSKLHKDGKMSVDVFGTDGSNTLPFHMNISARIDDDFRAVRLMECFSISIKFGGGSEDSKARVPVTKMDGNHGGWFTARALAAGWTHVWWFPDVANGYTSGCMMAIQTMALTLTVTQAYEADQGDDAIDVPALPE